MILKKDASLLTGPTDKKHKKKVANAIGEPIYILIMNGLYYNVLPLSL